MSDVAWDCSACGHHNDVGATCEACGVAKRYLDDPPLDLPYPPHLSHLPAFYAALLWAVAGGAGALALLMPAWRAALGLGPVYVALATGSALAAAWSSLTSALWQRLFNDIRLEVPRSVRSGEDFDATLTLVPYDHVEPVSVGFRLVDNFYQHVQGSVETRSRSLGHQLALLGEPLSGRHTHVLHARFQAPFPATRHTDVIAEVLASLLGMIAFLVPGLAFTARNLREHGGYFVSASVRVGWLRRTFKRRVIAYYIGADLYVG
ncbi:MAG: zinc finger Ran-binding domain-containing protein [Deinococcales bacterium]|jgi:hypothetical protein